MNTLDMFNKMYDGLGYKEQIKFHKTLKYAFLAGLGCGTITTILVGLLLENNKNKEYLNDYNNTSYIINEEELLYVPDGYKMIYRDGNYYIEKDNDYEFIKER